MTGAPRVVAIIPSRYVYERASKARLVNAVIVATDDGRIASAVRAFGGHAVMTPESLQSGTDRIAFAVQSMADADIVVNVQGDEPLLAPQMIDEAVSPLVDDERILVGTLVRRIDTDDELVNPNIVKVVLDNDHHCLYFSRATIPFGRDVAQIAWREKHLYYKHIGLYVFRRGFLLQFKELSQTPLEKMEKLEQLRILEHGFKIKAAITSHDCTPVDTQEDLEKVRAVLGDER
jgi:3-deoxy-manno-octulosonate cytidylyltransferase (CMP-KDO synthetase)